jgi:hypothetical protein
LQPINWPHVIATACCLALLGAGAIYFTTYQVKPFSEIELAASRARTLDNCGAGMFDVVPQATQCPRFDAIVLQQPPCAGPDCEAFVLSLHADGRAVLDVTAPAADAGRYTARIGAGEYRELANFIASFKLDRLGGFDPAPSEAAAPVVRAGCDGNWTVDVNHGGTPGEVEAIDRCLRDVKRRADWSLESDATVPGQASR